MTTDADDRSKREPAMPDIWLDVAQAAGLLGISTRRLARLIDEGALATRVAPSGVPGVMKSELVAWHRADLASRRGALAALAAQIDGEVFR